VVASVVLLIIASVHILQDMEARKQQEVRDKEQLHLVEGIQGSLVMEDLLALQAAAVVVAVVAIAVVAVAAAAGAKEAIAAAVAENGVAAERADIADKRFCSFWNCGGHFRVAEGPSFRRIYPDSKSPLDPGKP